MKKKYGLYIDEKFIVECNPVTLKEYPKPKTSKGFNKINSWFKSLKKQQKNIILNKI